MKLVWSPDRASKAYLETAKSCKKLKDSSVAELLAAMAAGWGAELIVESWTRGGPIAISLGLAIASRHTYGRHVCVVPDEQTRSSYLKAMQEAGVASVEVLVGEAEEAMAAVAGVDFLVVDNSKRKDFVRFAKLSRNGAVLTGAGQRVISSSSSSSGSGFNFKWQRVLRRGTRVVRTAFLPVGQGLDIAYIGAEDGGGAASGSRWIKHVDHLSGEEHIFRR